MGDLTLQTKLRLAYLDNLKVALTILVLLHHVGQAYGPTGGAWPVHTETVRAALLGPFFTVNRSFFMSLFFMISGYFMLAAYERNRVGNFLRSRFVRLGVPVLAWAAWSLLYRVVTGVHISGWTDVFSTDHLWYLEHLLLFGIVYALSRRLRGNRPPLQKADTPLPSTIAILAMAAFVAVASYLIRLWSPIDRWFKLLDFFSVAFADVPRDLAFFIVGAVAFRKDWLNRYPRRSGFVWLGVGLAAAALCYAYKLGIRTVAPMSPTTFALVYPAWEALLCVGMCIGLTVLFREALTFQGRLGAFLARNQFGAYVLQELVILPIQFGFLMLQLPPLVKFAVVSMLAVPLIFLLSSLLRRSPLVRAVI